MGSQERSLYREGLPGPTDDARRQTGRRRCALAVSGRVLRVAAPDTSVPWRLNARRRVCGDARMVCETESVAADPATESVEGRIPRQRLSRDPTGARWSQAVRCRWAKLRADGLAATLVCTIRANTSSMTGVTRITVRLSHGYSGPIARDWARTSEAQACRARYCDARDDATCATCRIYLLHVVIVPAVATVQASGWVTRLATRLVHNLFPTPRHAQRDPVDRDRVPVHLGRGAERSSVPTRTAPVAGARQVSCLLGSIPPAAHAPRRRPWPSASTAPILHNLDQD